MPASSFALDRYLTASICFLSFCLTGFLTNTCNCSLIQRFLSGFLPVIQSVWTAGETHGQDSTPSWQPHLPGFASGSGQSFIQDQEESRPGRFTGRDPCGSQGA